MGYQPFVHLKFLNYVNSNIANGLLCLWDLKLCQLGLVAIRITGNAGDPASEIGKGKIFGSI